MTAQTLTLWVSGDARMIWPAEEMEEPETAPPINLPPHKGSLNISHNEQRSYYQTVEQRLKDLDEYEADLTWESPEMRARAIETDEMWEMQWYPDTPVAFICVAAPTLPDLLRFALQQSKD